MADLQTIESLQARNLELEQDRQVVKDIFIKLAKALDLYPLPEDGRVIAKIIRVIPGMMIMSQTRPGEFEQKFSFFKDLLPIIEKFNTEDENSSQQ